MMLPAQSSSRSLGSPQSCGTFAWVAIPYIRRLIDLGRSKGVPIIYTHSYPRAEDATDPRPNPRNAIIAPLAPEPGDLLIEKEAASPFSTGQLLRKLIGHGIDTLIHTGCTTSGCVASRGLTGWAIASRRTSSRAQGVFDRAQIPHWVNLFDMDQKYADVLPVGQVEAWVAKL